MTFSLYRPKDYIQTPEGLIFAVVADGMENGKIRCFLRYAEILGSWRKLDSAEANAYLTAHFPEYLFYSQQLAASLHAVTAQAVVKHYSALKVLPELLAVPAKDQVLVDLQQLCRLLADNGVNLAQVGITGSILLGLQNHESDIDLLCYDRSVFQQMRQAVKVLIAGNHCQALNNQDWLTAFQRRGCDLSLDEYIWHEARKYNKAVINQRKFDLSLVTEPRSAHRVFNKLGPVCITAKVTDDYYGFDYPAEFALQHPEISRVVAFTATYTGQAKTGEQVIIAGQLEEDDSGEKRIVVGSSREAPGEYIKLAK